MNILAIETSVKNGTAAVVSEKKVLSEVVIAEDINYSVNLVSKVDFVLKKSSLELKDIDLLAVGIGPGSFTGIRIGVAFVRGVIEALNKSVVGISGFETVLREASGLKGKGLNDYDNIIILFDARRDEFYRRVYKNGQSGFEICEKDSIVKFGDLEEYFNKKTVFAGPDLHEILKQQKVDCGKMDADIMDLMPKAGAIAMIASELPVKEREKYSCLEPIYLRRTQAEEKLDVKHMG